MFESVPLTLLHELPDHQQEERQVEEKEQCREGDRGPERSKKHDESNDKPD